MPFISGGGGGTFTGGLLTSPLQIDLAGKPDAQAFEVDGATGGTADPFQVKDGNGSFIIEAFQSAGHSGGVGITSFDNTFPVLYLDHEGSAPTADVLTVAPGGSTRSRFNKAGYFMTRLHAAPADGDLATGELALWFDQTTGAPTVVWKAKQADATVVVPVVTGGGQKSITQTSGALPTVQLVTATGAQILTTRDAETVTPFTGDGTNNIASCAVAISPDNVTYSTVDTLSIAAALNLTGVMALAVNIRVPAGWYLKLTSSHGTIGVTTYY